MVTHDISEAISMADRIIVLSKRPSTVISEIPINLTITNRSALSARKAPEFSNYFNLLWKELYDNEKQS